jgi:hypothetical protein
LKEVGGTEQVEALGPLEEQGGDGNFDYNVSEVDRLDGTAKSYTLSRLKRDAPELFEQVKAGTLSANARGVHRQKG